MSLSLGAIKAGINCRADSDKGKGMWPMKIGSGTLRQQPEGLQDKAGYLV